MNVFLLEVGCYDDAYVAGVFSTPEKAMAAHQPKPTPRTARRGREYRDRAGAPWSFEWAQRDTGCWYFGADWENAAAITRYTVDA